MVATITDDTPLERQDGFKKLRRENRLREEKLRAEQLAQLEKQHNHRKLKESWQTEWVGPWMTAMRDMRDGFGAFGWGGGIWSRKGGINYPLYRTEQELALLRFPSRWLCSTNSYAIGFNNGLGGYILGSGLTYRWVLKDRDDGTNQPLADALQTVNDDILEANEWYGGEQPGFEEEYFKRTLEDGDGIALHYPDESTGVTDFRFAEPEQLTKPNGSNPEYDFGVLVDPKDTEKPLKYNIAWDEGKQDCQEFDPDEVTHFKRNVKRAMKRGVPDFSFDTYEALDAASKLSSAMGEAAAQQAQIVSVMKFKTGTQSEIQAVAMGSDYQDFNAYGGQQIGVRKGRKGTNEYIPDSQEYTNGPAASNATAHNEVLSMLLRTAGVRWNAPDWLGSSDASGNTFSNADTMATSFVNSVLREQRRYCAAFRRMIWYACRKFVEIKGGLGGKQWEEIITLIDLVVEAPEPVKKDPLADAQVAQIEIPLGVQSRQSYAQEMGRDWKQIENDNREWENDHGDIDPLTGAKLMADDPEDNGKPVKESWDESLHPRVDGGEHGGEFAVKKKDGSADREELLDLFAGFSHEGQKEFDWDHATYAPDSSSADNTVPGFERDFNEYVTNKDNYAKLASELASDKEKFSGQYGELRSKLVAAGDGYKATLADLIKTASEYQTLKDEFGSVKLADLEVSDYGYPPSKPRNPDKLPEYEAELAECKDAKSAAIVDAKAKRKTELDELAKRMEPLREQYRESNKAASIAFRKINKVNARIDELITPLHE